MHCLHSLQGQSVYIMFWFGFRLNFRVCLISFGTKDYYGESQLFHECLIGFTHIQNLWLMILDENNLFDEIFFEITFPSDTICQGWKHSGFLYKIPAFSYNFLLPPIFTKSMEILSWLSVF